MNLYVDLDSLKLVDGPLGRNPITALRFKRGDSTKLDVVFLQGDSSYASVGDPDTLELHFGVKQRNRYDAGYLVHTSAWTLPAPDATNPVYQCSPSFNTVELDAEFGGESSVGTEPSEVALMGEITWREGAGDPTSTRTFMVVVENDVNRGTEGVPLSASPPYPAPANIVTMSTLGNHAVRFDLAQSLTTEQKAQARENIGAGTGGGDNGSGNVVFRGGWSESETYAVGDWVNDGQRLYWNSTGANNVGAPSTDTSMYVWIPLTASSPGGGTALEWTGSFSYGTSYTVGKVVNYGGTSAFLCITDNVYEWPGASACWLSLGGSSSGASVSWAGEFSFGTPYTAGQVVSYNSVKYLCLADNSNELPDYSGNWVSFGQTSGFLTFRSEYSEYIPYTVGDIVTLSGVYYLCVAATTTGTAPHTNPYNWVRLSSEYRGEWDGLAYYSVGSIVTYGGALYIAIAPNGNSTPADYPASWTLLQAAPEVWLPLGSVVHDGMSLTSGPITMPGFLGASERIRIRATVNDFDTAIYYIDFTILNGALDTVIVGYSCADPGLSVVAGPGYPHLDGFNPPTTQLRAGDTWEYFMQVPAESLYMWGPSDQVTWMGNPFTPYLYDACYVTLEYQIVPR